jgi:predicted RNA-binding Zn ribbon-like protein
MQVVRTRTGIELKENLANEEGCWLFRVAESAAQFLSSGDPSLLRRCDSPGCILFFYDTTKNHARRFCSPATCGNRAKVAAYNARQRQGQTPR